MDAMHHDEEQNPVRRALNSLPDVRASKDFEMRLNRRIGKEDKVTLRQSIWERLFGSRVPAYALSLAAIVAVGLVAYYAFMRSGITPAADVTATTESKPAMQVGRHDTAHLPAVPWSEASQPQPSKTEPANVSVSKGNANEKSKDEISRSHDAAQEELLKRGSLQQVGSGETQSARPFEMPETSSLRQMKRVIMEKDPVSAARVGSPKNDSLKRLEKRKAKETNKK